MKLYQNAISPLEIPSTTAGYVQGILKDDTDNEIARVASFLADGRHIFYLDTLLRGAIKLPTPELSERYIVHENIIKNFVLEALEQNIEIQLYPGIESSSALRGSALFNLIRVEDIFPKTYFIEDETQIILKANYHGKIIELDTIDIVSTEAFVTVNWHQYFAKFSNYNSCILIVESSTGFIIHSQTVHFLADFNNFPSSFIFRNAFGFWDALRCNGTYEKNLNMISNNLETMTEVKNFYTEVFEKIAVNAGYLSFLERKTLGEFLQYANEIWQYDNALIPLVKDMKDFSSFNSADTTDTAKLEFRYAQTKRIYS